MVLHLSSVFASANHRWKLRRWIFSKTSPSAWTCCTPSHPPACSTEARTSVRSTQRDAPLSDCTFTSQVNRKATNSTSTVATASRLYIILSPLSAHISPHVLPLSVIPQLYVGHAELQELFDLCLLPGGQLLLGTVDQPLSIFHPTLVLLTACFTSVLLVVFLSLG